MYELKGSIVALITPLTQAGLFNKDVMGRLIQWHQESSTDGLMLLGSTGEGTLFSMDERQEIIDFVVNHPENRMPTWVGVSHSNPAQVQAMIQQSSELGADGVMVPCPMYVKPSQQGLIKYFTDLADQSSLPIMLYNIPCRTGTMLDVETACILSHHDNIMGIKDSYMTVDRMSKYQNSHKQFDVFCGDDTQKLTCLANGGAGVVSVLANVLPELVHAFCSFADQGVHHKAQAIDARWSSIANALTDLPNPSAIKYVLSQRGVGSPFVRQPLSQLSFEQEQQLADVLKEVDHLLMFNPECP